MCIALYNDISLSPVRILVEKVDTVDGKNPASLRMPEMYVLYRYQDLFGAGYFPSIVWL